MVKHKKMELSTLYFVSFQKHNLNFWYDKGDY